MTVAKSCLNSRTRGKRRCANWPYTIAQNCARWVRRCSPRSGTLFSRAEAPGQRASLCAARENRYKMQSADGRNHSPQPGAPHSAPAVSYTGRHHHASRMAMLSLLGIAVGLIGGLVAEGLLRTINFFSNICFYGRASSEYLPPNLAPHHWWFVLLPA